VDARTRPAKPVLRGSHEGSAFRAATALTRDKLEMSIAPQYTYRQLTIEDVSLLRNCCAYLGVPSMTAKHTSMLFQAKSTSQTCSARSISLLS